VGGRDGTTKSVSRGRDKENKKGGTLIPRSSGATTQTRSEEILVPCLRLRQSKIKYNMERGVIAGQLALTLPVYAWTRGPCSTAAALGKKRPRQPHTKLTPGPSSAPPLHSGTRDSTDPLPCRPTYYDVTALIIPGSRGPVPGAGLARPRWAAIDAHCRSCKPRTAPSDGPRGQRQHGDPSALVRRTCRALRPVDICPGPPGDAIPRRLAFPAAPCPCG